MRPTIGYSYYGVEIILERIQNRIARMRRKKLIAILLCHRLELRCVRFDSRRPTVKNSCKKCDSCKKSEAQCCK